MFQATRLKHQVLHSELEALLIEAELIRTHQPQYNILLKDDKSVLYVQITDEKFPRVMTIRKKDTEQRKLFGTILGPFPSAYRLKEVLEIARKIFPYCNGPRDHNYGKPDNKPCFAYHLDQCPGACIGEISAEEYQATLEQLALFLKGKKKDVVREIEEQMKVAAENEQFELAAELRDRINNIKEVTEKKLSLKPELNLPRLKEAMHAEGMIQLRRLLTTHMHLPRTYPLTRIECYDVSNIQGTNATVAQVVFLHAEPAKEEYRLYNIRTINTPNDFAMLQEALVRRQNHPEWEVPSLIIIDGGKGQLKAALKVWHWHLPVISIAKKPDRLIFPIFASDEKGATSDQEKSLQGLTYHELTLPADHPGLKLAQQLRDEAHRFSKKQHARMRTRAMLE